jgi:hypothetical protein
MTDESSPEKRPGTVHRHKARREHACAECPVPIAPGESYMFLNTFDRGKWSRYVLCQKCERIRICHKITEMVLDLEISYAAGKLREEVRGFFRQYPNYQHIFNSAWEDSLPVEQKKA